MTSSRVDFTNIPHMAIVKLPRLLPVPYRLAEAAEEIGVTSALLRNWRRAGLPTEVDSGGNTTVHGRALADWIGTQCDIRVPPVFASGREIDRDNYVVVCAFLGHLCADQQLDPASVTVYRSCLRRLLIWAGSTPLRAAAEIRPALPTHLTNATNEQNGKKLVLSTIKKTLNTSQRFFEWARQTHPRQYRQIPERWVTSLVPARQMKPISEHHYYSLDDVLKLVTCEVAIQDLALRRDQAAAALLFLSGMRAGALVSLPISAVDMTNHAIRQLAALGVRTKNGKSAVTYLLPIPELLDVVHTWDAFIRGRLPASAMWYTPVVSQHGDQCLSAQAAGTHRRVALGKRLRHLCSIARVPFQSAHKFRHGHAVWALQQAETMADYKAISQNLMHANISITDGIYAMLQSTDVRRRIANLRPAGASTNQSNEADTLSGRQMAAVLRRLADQLSDA